MNPVPCTWSEAAVKPAQGTRNRPALDRSGNPGPVPCGQAATNRTSRTRTTYPGCPRSFMEGNLNSKAGDSALESFVNPLEQGCIN